MEIPAADVEVDASLVRCLLREQFPVLAQQPITFLNNGWDNYLFRLGSELMVRLPRRHFGAELILKEQKYLPLLAPRLPLPVPVPLHVGQPGCDYPWYWSISAWLAGESVDDKPLPASSVKQWAEFLTALHIAAPENGPRNEYRGVPLATRHDAFMERLLRLRDQQLVNFEAVNILWQQGLDADADFSPCWLHGDLHPMNILSDNDRIVGVIDWGDLCVGDVATDLASFFMLFPKDVAEHSMRHDYHAGEAQITRARTCAAFFAVVLLDTGINSSPRQTAVARRIFSNLGLP